MKRNIKIALVSATFLAPVVSFGALEGLTDLLSSLKGLVNAVIPIIFGLALIYFFWGTAQFILHAQEPKAREEGKQRMVWGIVALFVMFSIFGILHWLSDVIAVPLGGAVNL